MNTTTYTLTKRELLNYKKQLHHKKILRRRFAFGILSILLILLFVFCINSFSTHAGDELPETTYKYFSYHTVDKGDSLWSMAEEHIDYDFYNSLNDYIEEVKEINHLTDDTIKIGQTIVIPYFSNVYQ